MTVTHLSPQLSLVTNREKTRFENLCADSTPDEIASVLTFALGRHIDEYEIFSTTDWDGAA